MISEYLRPKTIEEALKLLARPDARPLGGGTVLNQPSADSFTVVDLQALGLDKIRKSGEKLEVGATATLQALLESRHVCEALKKTIRLEAPLNLRDMGTVAGTIVSCDGRSPFVSALLALDAKIDIRYSKGEAQISNIGDFLPSRPERILIVAITIPLNVDLRFESVARTPADKPIVCAALARWPSGRTRFTLGGWGSAPCLALDGNEPSGIEEAARNAAQDSGDEWASTEYRSEMAAVLAKRCARESDSGQA
jgi:CO/xanthine dehydrogenase FAD-binding subunit